MENTRRLFWGGLLVWGLVIFVGALFGLWERIPMRGFGPLVAAGIVWPVVLYFRSARLQEFIASVNLRGLIGFHVWRIPAGLAFFWYGAHGLLPQRFVENAGWGDILVGLLAIPVALGPLRWRRLVAFEVFSLLDFAVAVGTGLTFTLLQVPLQGNLRAFPIVLIPFFGVCVTGALSVMTLSRLLRSRPAVSSTVTA